jgi:unsaturated chondroitin disaccharide hydrolase
LWLAYLFPGDEWSRARAERYPRLIEHRKTDRTVHDLGFVFWPTWNRWYDLTGDRALNQVVIQAGRTLALRYQPNVRYLRSFVSVESLFIDIMVNVGIVFYAARETDYQVLWQVAHRHCLTTRRYLARGDGSTPYESIFDAGSGSGEFPQ